jgi:hypothetical protein
MGAFRFILLLTAVGTFGFSVIDPSAGLVPDLIHDRDHPEDGGLRRTNFDGHEWGRCFYYSSNFGWNWGSPLLRFDRDRIPPRRPARPRISEKEDRPGSSRAIRAHDYLRVGSDGAVCGMRVRCGRLCGGPQPGGGIRRVDGDRSGVRMRAAFRRMLQKGPGVGGCLERESETRVEPDYQLA